MPRKIQNTSAPALPDKPAEVSATGGAEAPPQAAASVTGIPPGEAQVLPPGGEASPLALVITHLQVRALVDGFRRAGRAWPAEETIVPAADFTEAQIRALLAESALVVVPMALGDAGAA